MFRRILERIREKLAQRRERMLWLSNYAQAEAYNEGFDCAVAAFPFMNGKNAPMSMTHRTLFDDGFDHAFEQRQEEQSK